MAQFSQLITTKQGQILIAKMLSGTNGIKFTRITTSSTRYEINQLEDLTELGDTKQSVLVSKVSRPSEITVQVEAAVKNDEVMTGYYLRSIGLYAIDPDVGEVLFAVTIETSGNCYMPAYNGVAVSGAYIKLVARVSNSEIVNLEVDPAASATVGDIMNKLDFDSDISETVIETLETTTEKYPIPSAGEKVKTFFGKILTFLKNIKPLEADMTVYVATTGSDTTGDGSVTAPYKTITYAISKVPNDLGGHVATISIADGTYDEDVVITGVANGYFRIQRNGIQELNSLCNVKSIYVENCDNISISGFNITIVDGDGIFINRTDFVNVAYCQSISNAPISSSFRFDYVLNVRVSGNKSLNHDICLRGYSSKIHSENWTDGSLGIRYGIYADGGAQVTKGGILQPRGLISSEASPSSIITSPYGAVIGTLKNNTTLYVSPTGSDITGNGAQANPFKTIQFALNSLPRDLGAYTATIDIADGSYGERVTVTSFYNGRIYIRSSKPNEVSSVCNVIDITVVNNSTTLIEIRGINFTTTTTNAVYAVNSGFILVAYCRCVTTSTWSGFSFDQTRFEASYNLVANRGIALSMHGSDGNSFNWEASSTGNTIGIHAEYGGMVKKAGVQPKGTAGNERTIQGGLIFNENGTQISGITSGLSCTWGTITGGYYRNGAPSSAMITIQLRVTLTTNLSAGTTYTITGFPLPNVSTAVAVHDIKDTRYCAIETNGNLYIELVNAIPSGNYLLFNCTYF